MVILASKDIGPDFSKFKRIPPAFAGTVIDWSMGSREITATVIDLILRDHLSVVGNRVINNRRTLPIRNFEKNMIKAIFGSNDSLTFDQFSQIAYKKYFDNLLKIIADGMIEEGYVEKNFQVKLSTAVKESIKELPAAVQDTDSESTYSKPVDYKNAKVVIIPGWMWIIIGIVLGFLFLLSLAVPFIGNILAPIWFIVIFFAIFAFVMKRKLNKKLGKGYDWMLTDAGKKIKVLSIELKRYMETYPLLEDRLANELVGFAIAFGLGKVWMRKLGKFDANLKIFVESSDSQSHTIYRFMDWEKYLKSFEDLEK
ncbi:MAG: DUF2207 family protein [Candidatus Woesearchaeota archaeon]